MPARIKAAGVEARKARQEPSARLSLLAAATSGFLLILAFPKFNLHPLAAVALLPLLIMTAKEHSAGWRFIGGFLGGLIFFGGACYWIYLVQRDYGGVNVPGAVGIFVLFCCLFAFYWGVFAWLAGYLWKTSWAPAAIPLLWVALEYARTYTPFGGFPWLLTGYALTDYFPLARLARWTGVYGLSYLLLALPVACLWLFVRPGRVATVHLVWIAAVLAVLSLAAPAERYTENQRAYLVQTNIPQDAGLVEEDARTQAPLLRRLRTLTLGAMGRQAQPGASAALHANGPAPSPTPLPAPQPTPLVVWPEVPVPFYYNDDMVIRQYAEQMARDTGSDFIMGIVAYVPGSNRTEPLNSMVLLDPSGTLISQYDKIHLVPFGEYVPLRRWVVLAQRLTSEIGDFVPGRNLVVSTLPPSGAGSGPAGKLSGIICYEAIFPDLVRRFVHAGAEVLVNISDDGWYGRSAARSQHLLMARMRAIENRRYLLRDSNNGITAVIRPNGRIAERLAPDRAAVLAGRWSFEQDQTFYTRHGDIFAMLACVAAALACLAGWIAGQRDRKPLARKKR